MLPSVILIGDNSPESNIVAIALTQMTAFGE